MSPHFFDHILYILDASEKIELMVKHLPEAEEDHGTFEGILYKLQTLSESASKLPDDIKQNYPAVKWKQFYRMRNVVVHDYLGDDSPEQVLEFIRSELPKLIAAMEQQLPEWKELRARMKPE